VPVASADVVIIPYSCQAGHGAGLDANARPALRAGQRILLSR
jgi:hypothetical protein